MRPCPVIPADGICVFRKPVVVARREVSNELATSFEKKKKRRKTMEKEAYQLLSHAKLKGDEFEVVAPTTEGDQKTMKRESHSIVYLRSCYPQCPALHSASCIWFA